eukprot:88987_1
MVNFEKFIDGFLKTVMNKWKLSSCNHVYSIIFFSRTYYNFILNDDTPNNAGMNGVFNKDSDNRYYKDHYMVVVRNWNTNNYNKLSKKLRNAFDIFPKKVKWNKLSEQTLNVSVASDGNLLEAIQLALNVLDKHYIDRDLFRTGVSITVITAGNGLYFVDKSLATFTKVRILNNGINCDIVSMARPPLHPTPLFVYGSPLSFEENKWETLSYSQPTEMMQIKFFDYNPSNESPIVESDLLYKKTASFLTLKNECKTFIPLSLGDTPTQMSNIVENNENKFYNIYAYNNVNSGLCFDEYDTQIFEAINTSKSNISNTPMRYANINKRNYNNDMLSGRMFVGGDDDKEIDLDDDEEMDLNNIKDNYDEQTDIISTSNQNKIIVIQHKDSYQNTPFNNSHSIINNGNISAADKDSIGAAINNINNINEFSDIDLNDSVNDYNDYETPEFELINENEEIINENLNPFKTNILAV